MRRALPVIASTAGGLALLANFHTTSGAASIAAGSSPPPTPATQSPTTTPTPGGAGSTPTTSAPPTTPSGNRTVDGPVVSTDYGDVQVRVTLNGSKIVDVQALQLPYDRSRSERISQQAGPLLRQEALRAQSANIDLLSGATYTSEGYAQSLQGALNQASR
jgi:uncharacterized protein with FMN-binding domain